MKKNNIKLKPLILFFLLSLAFLAIGKFLFFFKPLFWKYKTNNQITFYNPPGRHYELFTFDQKNLYFNDEAGYTHSLNSQTGRENWRFRNNQYSIYPIVYDDRFVYLTSFDGRLYSLDKNTGQENWRFVTPGLIKADTEPMLSDNLIYFGSRNGVFYALDKLTGEKKWEFKTRGIDNSNLDLSQPIIHFGLFEIDDTQVYINSSTDNAIYALDKLTGEMKWEFRNYKYLHHKLMLGQSFVAFYSNNNYYFSLDKKTGKVIWQQAVTDYENENLVVLGDNLYFKTKSNTLIKLDNGGKIQWQYNSRENIQNIEKYSLINDDKIFLTLITHINGGSLVVLDSLSGKEEWSFATDSLFQLPPKVGENAVYIVSGGNLYILDKANGKIKSKFFGLGVTKDFYLTPTNIYLINKSGEDELAIYFFDKESASEKWHYVLTKIDSTTIALNNTSLFLASADRNVFYSIQGGHNPNQQKLIDINKVNLFDKFLNRFKVLLPDRQIKITTSGDSVGKYETFELTINHKDDHYQNVWEDVNILVDFTDESRGEFHVRGFYYDKNTWKVRFTPTTLGRWQWQLYFKNSLFPVTKVGSFTVQETDNPGFLKINSVTPDRLVYANDQLFYPLGIQNSFRDDNHTGDLLNQLLIGENIEPVKFSKLIRLYSFNDYLKVYGPEKSGFNLFRINIDNCYEKLWREIGLSGNSYSVDAGLHTDQLVQKLKDNHMRIWFSLFSFKIPFDGSIKDRNYQEALKHYLDYVVDRYAASVDIWELANEIYLDSDWVEYAAAYLRLIDPYKHPITTNWGRADLSMIDINSIHWYKREAELNTDLITVNKIAEAKIWGKPVVFSEQGNLDVSWDNNSALRMRIRLWTAFFQNAGIIFWNTSGFLYENPDSSANIYLGPVERQAVKVLSNYIQDLETDLKPIIVEVKNTNIRGFGLSSSKHFLLYLHNGSNHQQIASTIVTLNLPKNGTLVWIDPQTGQIIESRQLKKIGNQQITTPVFKIDLALKIKFEE